MESLKHTTEGRRPALHRKCQLRRRWWVAIGVAVGIVVILVIVLPLALILPNRGDKGSPSRVIFPLYIYPETNSTWGPLYEAIQSHPDLSFLVVVNPQSGPGNGSAPDEAYQVAIRQLDTYANVQKVGYVRTNYAERNVSEVLDDIATYSGWETESSDLAMAGIFFDEAPHQYAEGTAEYLTRINAAVKDATGLQGDRTVILNPGVIPDTRLSVPNTDITVTFEQSYSHYSTSQESVLKAATADRATWAYIFHSVPEMSESEMRRFVDDISHRAQYLYLTTRTDSYYEHFDSSLEEIESHPNLPFLIIINPNSGPGDTEYPDENYTREILRLNSYANVTTIGYVRIDYCRRPLDEVVGEIERGLGMRGIFVDETPNHFDAERGVYLAEVRRVVKGVDGILGERLVVHNPGTAPSAALLATQTADLTITCEEPYHHYRSAEVQDWLGLNPMARDQAGYMVSGVPAEAVQELVRELRHRSGYVFVTDTEVDFYESFGESWAGFVRAMQEVD
ncbi:spherulation-specific family 4 protein [Aspergillus stella-maris]|uniref:spherulation-specific family 4 protein n=1 Tax=Aspergillus stella-maris TaxID=1810926 RepID=UPI003CCDBEB8